MRVFMGSRPGSARQRVDEHRALAEPAVQADEADIGRLAAGLIDRLAMINGREELPEEPGVEPETERKIAGKDKTTPIPANMPVRLGEVFLVGLSANISPDRNRMANVPTLTANWKIAA